MKKGDRFYYARIMPSTGIYEVCDLKIRTISGDRIACLEDRTKHVFLFGLNSIGKNLFSNRKDALNKVIEAEKNKCKVSEETYYEEY